MATLQVALQKTSSIKMFEQPRQALRALVGIGKPLVQQQIVRPTDIANPRVGESFSHLKLTAERMLQEQACAKSDLEIAKAKLAKCEEQLRMLEAKNQEISNENAMLKVKHNEDTKLWTSLEAKFSSASAFFDQITETLHSLESQVEQAETTKKILEERLRNRDDGIEKDLTRLRNSLQEATVKLEAAEKNSEYKQLLIKEQESAAQRIDAMEKMVAETRKQAEIQLEAKQADIARHLKELSQRNDQAMLEMKRQYEKDTKETLQQEHLHQTRKLQEDHKQALESVSSQLKELQAKYQDTLESGKKEVLNAQDRHAEVLRKERDSADQRIKAVQQERLQEINKLEEMHKQALELASSKQEKLECKYKDVVAKLEKIEEELEVVRSRNKELLVKEHDLESKLKSQITDLESKCQDALAEVEKLKLTEAKLKEAHAQAQAQAAAAAAAKMSIEGAVKDKDETHKTAEARGASQRAASFQAERFSDEEPTPIENVSNITRVRKHVKKTVEAKPDGKKTLAKRKRAQEPKTKSRKRPARKQVQRVSDDDDGEENDLFGAGFLDPYADDPYAFG